MQDKLNPAFAVRLREAVVVPVLTVESAAQAMPLVEALRAGGLDLIEVTLRTKAALEALAALAGITGVTVGAGTVLTPDQARAAIDAGAGFIVSPGASSRMDGAAAAWKVPWLPGAATPTEVMQLRDRGYRTLKFFPAEAAGGAAYLKALAAPLADVAFCPTGGIEAGNAGSYLALPNVVAVGGSWVAPAKLVAARDWAGITRLARAAKALGHGKA